MGIVHRMLAKGLWKTGGKTPASAINVAILREIHVTGVESQFRKTDRGLFTIKHPISRRPRSRCLRITHPGGSEM